jgi:hypothetical protein
MSNPNHDARGKFSSGADSAAASGDHQAAQSKPVGPGRQPKRTGPQTKAHPSAGSRIAFALRNKLLHDAGKDERLASYAAAHGGQQAASANGARSPIGAHMGVKSVGTHPASGGGGGGGGGGGDVSSGGNIRGTSLSKKTSTRSPEHAITNRTSRRNLRFRHVAGDGRGLGRARTERPVCEVSGARRAPSLCRRVSPTKVTSGYGPGIRSHF